MDNALIISSATHAGQLARLPHSDVGGHASLPRCCTMHHFGVCFWLFLLWCVLFCSVLLCSVLFVLSFRSRSWSRSRSCPGFVLFCFVFWFLHKTIKTSIAYLGREFHQRRHLLRTFLVCLGLRFLARSGIVLPTFLVCLGLLLLA